MATTRFAISGPLPFGRAIRRAASLLRVTFGVVALGIVALGLAACTAVATPTPSPDASKEQAVVVAPTAVATATSAPADPAPTIAPTFAPTSAPPTPTSSPTSAPTFATTIATTIASTPTLTSLPSATPTSRPPAVPTPKAAGDIVVVEPTKGQLLTSPIRVQGLARAFEATIEIEVDVGGKQVYHAGIMTSAGAPEWGVYDVTIDVDLPPGTQPLDGTVRVMIPSMKDTSYVEVVSVPVRILPPSPRTPTPATRVVKVYFERSIDNELTFVGLNRTVPWTLGLGRAALEELLKGPSTSEKQAGYWTAIPAGTKLLGLKIENGVAYADFDQTLKKGAIGSTAIYVLTQQIRLTFLQFETVRQVVISVEGQTAGILEP